MTINCELYFRYGSGEALYGPFEHMQLGDRVLSPAGQEFVVVARQWVFEEDGSPSPVFLRIEAERGDPVRNAVAAWTDPRHGASPTT